MHTADMTEDTQSTEHEQPGGSATAGDTSLSPRVALFAPGASAEEIASLEQVIGSSWPELRIVTWPDGQAFSTSAVWFRACVLHVKGPSPLEGELAARPQALPLIAVGGHDPGRARPNVWLREVNPKLLGAVLQAFLMEPDGASVVAHRADDDLSVQVVAPPIIAYRDAKARFESAYYTRLLRLSAGNISLAAKLAHKTRKEVYDAMKRLGLRLVEYRARGEA